MKNELIKAYGGRVLMSPGCLNDPVIVASLESLSQRNFEQQNVVNGEVWWISDRH